jgi:peptidyl-prolyl cis-trans isomerase B (cyclophilin B)
MTDMKRTAPNGAEIDATRQAGTRRATIVTEKGDIVIDLYGADAPLTVANFVKLAETGYFDGLSFHRVVANFVVQGGDPDGTGGGGPGYSINLEIAPNLSHGEGAVAMARTSNPNSAGSQFYITLAPTPHLDKQYAIFGQVVQGMDVVKSIKQGDRMTKVTLA